MEQPHTLLEINHVAISFRSAVALEDVTLKAYTGEIHALLGADGAGKTTLMKILSGLYPAPSYRGEILLDGTPVTIRSPKDALQLGIAVVSRRPAVFGSLSVAENIVMGNWQFNHSLLINRQKIGQEAEATLKWMGVTLDLEARAETLDPAQKRVVALARALSIKPRLVVLDEPAAHATGVTAMSQLMRMVRLLASENITTLYLARIPAEAIQIADRITVLRDGRTVGTFDRTNFDATELSVQMMSQHPERGAGIEDEPEGPGGLFGSLRAILRLGSRG